MKKINFAAVITVILSCSFFGCDYFNVPMKELIMDNSIIVKGIGYQVNTPHHERSITEVVIPPYEPDKPYETNEPDKPDEPAKITIFLYNPRNFNLKLELTGDINSQTASAEVELAQDKQTAIVTINNPSRFDTFDLTLNMESDEGRPMTPYKLPKIECRYINNYLRVLSVDSRVIVGTPEFTYPTDGSLIPAFDPKNVDYTVYYPEGTTSVTISNQIYSGKYSSYSIRATNDADKNFVDKTLNSTNESPETNTYNLFPGVNTILMTVTADSGIAKTYTILVKVRSGLLNITFDKIIDEAPYIIGPTINRSEASNNTKATLTVATPTQYTSIDWYIYLPGNLGSIHGTGASFTLDSKNTAYNSIGEHFLTLVVVKNGITYNSTIIFTVDP